MVGMTTYRSEKGSSTALMNEIIGVFKSANGAASAWFTQVGADYTNGTTNQSAVLLEDTAQFDPILTTLSTRVTTDGLVPTPDQKIRLYFLADKNSSNETVRLRVYWGTNQQIPNNDPTSLDAGTPFITLWDQTCYPRPYQSVYSYRITIVPRGFAMMLWKNDQPNVLAPGNTALVIQRPVQPGGTNAGKYRETGRIPFFVLDIESGRPTGEEIMFSVAREEDINTALRAKNTIGAPNTNNLYGINMSWNHPNILSNFTHVIRIPFGLATDRHLYMEEMDLVAMTQATSFILDQVAELDMYGQAREYAATFGLVDYGYAETQKILGGVRMNILTAIDKTNTAGANFITVV